MTWLRQITNNLYDDACFLFDGGWRSIDRDEMKAEYRFSDDEVDEVVRYLKEFEQKEVIK